MSHQKPESDPTKKTYLSFQTCKAKCFKSTCKECGYFWGPGNEKVSGRHISWTKTDKPPTA